MTLALCIILATIGGRDVSESIEQETVDIIRDNCVYDSHKPRQRLVYRQFIFYRWRQGEYQVCGYLMVRDDTVWDLPKRGQYHCLEFQARDGSFRRICAKTLDKADTRHDPEMADRKHGDRDCLFGLVPWGDVRG